jgi:hypothetical protein
MSQEDPRPVSGCAPLNRRAFMGAAATAAAAATVSGFSATATAAAPEQGSRVSAAVASFYGAPDPQVPQVGLRWVFSATVFFADRIMIGSPLARGYTSVAGGEIWGPRLQGRVLPASGADYYKGSFSTYYMFEAADGALIFIHNRGTMRRFQTPPEPGKPLVPASTTEPGAAVWTRFRATPVFTAPVGAHDWMNRTVFVANAQRQEHPDHTVFTYYEVL